MKKNKDKGTIRDSKRSPIEFIISIANKMIDEGTKLQKPPLTKAELKAGYQSAVNSTRPFNEVAMTPLMKNMLHESGCLPEGKRLFVTDPITKVEKWLMDVCKNFIQQHSDLDHYDESLSVYDVRHYWVDCLDNIPSNWRHTWPEPKEKLEQVVDVYQKPYKPPKMSFYDMLKTDAGKVAFDYLDHSVPRVAPEQIFKLTAMPFEHRDSSTGFPFCRNARTVDPDSGKTYGELSVQLAEKTPLRDLWKYNAYVEHVRYQRGTERMVWGSSSVVNSSLNRLARMEVNAYKAQSPLYLGYNDAKKLREGMKSMGDFCEQHGFKCRNNDQAKYDRHISPSMKAFAEGFRYFKAITSLGKEIAMVRGQLGQQGYVQTRSHLGLTKVYPRMYSGELDTNSSEGMVSELTNVYSLQTQDPDYKVKILYAAPYVMLVMGDDILFIYDPTHYNQEDHVNIMAQLGLDVHQDKGEFGLFFLQWRLCKVDGRDIFVRPFTRTVRSLLFKERPVGLGPYGWLLSTWQQFEGLVEFPEVLDFVVSLTYPFDSLHLGVDVTIDQIKEEILKEDQEAIAKSGSQARTTADRLFDGDPQKGSLFNELDDGKVEINFSSDYLSNIQRAIIDSVNRVKPSLANLKEQYGFPSPE